MSQQSRSDARRRDERRYASSAGRWLQRTATSKTDEQDGPEETLPTSSRFPIDCIRRAKARRGDVRCYNPPADGGHNNPRQMALGFAGFDAADLVPDGVRVRRRRVRDGDDNRASDAGGRISDGVRVGARRARDGDDDRASDAGGRISDGVRVGARRILDGDDDRACAASARVPLGHAGPPVDDVPRPARDGPRPEDRPRGRVPRRGRERNARGRSEAGGEASASATCIEKKFASRKTKQSTGV